MLCVFDTLSTDVGKVLAKIIDKESIIILNQVVPLCLSQQSSFNLYLLALDLLRELVLQQIHFHFVFVAEFDPQIVDFLFVIFLTYFLTPEDSPHLVLFHLISIVLLTRHHPLTHVLNFPLFFLLKSFFAMLNHISLVHASRDHALLRQKQTYDYWVVLDVLLVENKCL